MLKRNVQKTQQTTREQEDCADDATYAILLRDLVLSPRALRKDCGAFSGCLVRQDTAKVTHAGSGSSRRRQRQTWAAGRAAGPGMAARCRSRYCCCTASPW